MDDRHARLLSLPGAAHRRMMGADCILVDGRMFAIFPAEPNVAMKLPEEDRMRFLSLSGAGPFVVSRGPFGDWLQAPLDSLDDGALLDFARSACEHVRSLPRTKPRKKKSPGRRRSR